MLTHLLRDDRGELNIVKILFYFGVAAAAYFAWIYVPLEWDHVLDVRKMVRQACNVAYAARSDGAVRKSLFTQMKALDLKNQKLSSDGTTVVEEPVKFDDDNIDTIDIQNDPPEITVKVHYERTVVWPFLKKEKTIEYEYEHTENLAIIKY